MTEKEAYINEWIKEISTPKDKLGGFSVCPYASGSKTLIVETTIDDINDCEMGIDKSEGKFIEGTFPLAEFFSFCGEKTGQ